MMHFSWANCI